VDFASSTKFRTQKFSSGTDDIPCSLILGQVNLLNFIHEKSVLMVNP